MMLKLTYVKGSAVLVLKRLWPFVEIFPDVTGQWKSPIGGLCPRCSVCTLTASACIHGVHSHLEVSQASQAYRGHT